MAVSEGAQSGARGALPIGVAAYSFGYRCGFVEPLGQPTPEALRPRGTWRYEAGDLIDLAVTHRLGGVEFPLAWGLDRAGTTTLVELRDRAEAHGLFVVVDSGIVDVSVLRAVLPAAAAIGARTVRATISAILCGDRRAVRDTWPDYLDEIARRLTEVCGLAEETGVSIALENHQDVTAAELVALCAAVASPWIGVTLDTANPLAVGEDPLSFAARIAPYLKHVHLKDYRLYATPQGYRLARCALGAGVIDVQGMVALCARIVADSGTPWAPGPTVAIELGALQDRHVRLLEDDFWPGYPPRRIEEILPVLRLRDQRARPAGEDWRTPWQRGEDGEVLAAYELDEFEDSVRYLERLLGSGTEIPTGKETQ